MRAAYEASIPALILCTVPLLSLTIFATRLIRSLGQRIPDRLDSIGISNGRPSFLPLATARLRPAAILACNIERSNSANAPHI